MTAATNVDAPAWLVDFYAKVDALDTEGVLAGFAPGATMIYGAQPPMVGTDAVRGGLTYLFTFYAKIGHGFRNVWTTASTVLLEAGVTYGLPDGTEVTVPALTVIDHRDGLIDALRIFIDPTPVQSG